MSSDRARLHEHGRRVSFPAAADHLEAEFRLSPRDFESIALMLRAEAGISLLPSKSTLVYARLAKRLRVLGVTDFAAYVAMLHSPHGAEERRHMVTALTTNVTRFFREPHHFEHLRSSVLPALLRSAREGTRVRLWSAACSTGQEAYSLAAIMAELMPDAAALDVRILATDIDPVVLEHAVAGRYASLDGVPPDLQHWFERTGEQWTAKSPLRSLLKFKQLNLTRSWPIRGTFDVVLCRNVTIYFDAEVQNQVWQALAEVMRPGGMLYVGHSERLTGLAAEAFENVGITTYRRRGALA